MGWQAIITLALFVAAVFYLGWRLLARRSPAKGGGCACCKASCATRDSAGDGCATTDRTGSTRSA